MPKGGLNIYSCSKHTTVTIDRDEGITPSMVECFHNGCTEDAHSCFYRVPIDAGTPTIEWFIPTSLKGLSMALREHVEMGGLIHRPLPTRRPGVAAS